MTNQTTPLETFSRDIRNSTHEFTAGELVTCYRSGYYVIQSFHRRDFEPTPPHAPNRNVMAVVKKVYKTREPMRRPSTYVIRAEQMNPVSAYEVERMFVEESERARVKYNTLAQFAKT